MKRTNRLPSRRAGQGLVEFALVLPVLLYTIFGIINVMIAGIGWFGVQQAARAGSQQAAFHGGPVSGVGIAVANEVNSLPSLALNPQQVTVAVLDRAGAAAPVTLAGVVTQNSQARWGRYCEVGVKVTAVHRWAIPIPFFRTPINIVATQRRIGETEWGNGASTQPSGC